MRTNDEIMDVLDRLKEAKNLSISEISRRTGVAKSSVSRYFNRTREFPLNRAAEFAKAFGIEPDYLLGVDFNLPTNIQTFNEFAKIPILGIISCGEPILAEENIEDYLTFPQSLLPNGVLFGLVTKGDSMFPTIAENSKVIIRQQSDVENGEIAAVIMNGDTEVTLKRVKTQGDIMMLVADNPSYGPMIINEDNPARILGKAIKVISDL